MSASTNNSYSHSYRVKVYLEDTDALGLVYHTHFLKYAERARTDLLEKLGFSHQILLKEQDLRFVLRRCLVDFLSPAFLGDELNLTTYFYLASPVRLVFQQAIYRAEKKLCILEAHVVGIDHQGQLQRLPPHLLIRFSQLKGTQSWTTH